MLEVKEHELLEATRTDAGWKLVEQFAVTRREEPQEVRRGAEILVGEIRKAGLSVAVHDPEIFLALPVETTVEVAGVGFKAKAAAGSPETPSFSAKMVYLPPRDATSRAHTNDPAQLFGDGFTTERLRKMVSGQVVLTGGLSNPARSELLQKLGALAVITINPGEFVHWGASSVVWGSPGIEELDRLPTVPSIAVANTDAVALIAAAHEGVDVTIAVKTITGWFHQPIPEVTIAGRESTDDFLLIHGHYDSWDVGVGDNATGNAVLLEVARALQQNPPRNNVRIVWWPGHSAGRYAGSTWYSDTFAHDLRDHCFAHLDVDSPGCKDATDYSSFRAMSEASSLIIGAVEDLFGQTPKLERPGRAGDYSFNNLGLSGAMLTSSMIPLEERKRRGWYSVGGNGGSPTWHTEFDQRDVADREVLHNDIKLYSLLAWRMAEPIIPPLDYRLPLAEIRQQFDKDVRAAEGCVDLTKQADALKAFEIQVDGFYRTLESNPSNGRQYAVVQKAFGQHIVRMNYSIGGAFAQDPALALPNLPLLTQARQHPGKNPAVRITLQRNANALLAELREALKACAY